MEIKRKRGRPPGSKNKPKILSQNPNIVPDKDRKIGHALERANECGSCGGKLEATDGHFHTRGALGYYGAEPICCKCGNHNLKEAS